MTRKQRRWAKKQRRERHLRLLTDSGEFVRPRLGGGPRAPLHFVDFRTGDDRNDGRTSDTPKRTLKAALALTPEGENSVVYLMDTKPGLLQRAWCWVKSLGGWRWDR